MPALETPPNPAPPQPAPDRPLSKVPAGRFGELDHHELVRLLDSLDDERERSRFRESVYVSLLFYLVLGWFLVYGPRVLWHTPVVASLAEPPEKPHQLTYLETPKNLSKLLPHTPPKVISDKTAVAQTAHPTPDKKTLEQLEAMRRAGAPTPPPKPAPTSRLPPAPQPQPAQPQPAQQPQVARVQPPPTPQPRPQPNASIPEAPRPSQAGRPSFSTPESPGEAIARAAHDAAVGRGNAGEDGAGATPNHLGTNTGAEILSDTLNVDFGPYIKRLLAMVRASWIPLIPEETRPPLNKEGSTLIRFTIKPDGTVSYMHLDGSTRDQAIDRAAWGGITGVGQFPPLPANFKGPELDLRIQFNITHYRRAAE